MLRLINMLIFIGLHISYTVDGDKKKVVEVYFFLTPQEPEPW